MNLDFDVDGIDEAIRLRVRASSHFRDELQDILGEAAKLALHVMQQRVPRGNTGYSNRHLASTDPGFARTIADSLGMDAIVYRPGAAGGGGYYELNVGAVNNPPEHLQYVFEGTRGYPFNWRSRRRGFGYPPTRRSLTPARGRGNMAKVMVIWKQGEAVKFRMSRKGQKPQQGWFHDGYRAANAFLYARIQNINLRDL